MNQSINTLLIVGLAGGLAITALMLITGGIAFDSGVRKERQRWMTTANRCSCRHTLAYHDAKKKVCTGKHEEAIFKDGGFKGYQLADCRCTNYDGPVESGT
ncbi:hypothetical protein FDA94_28550 [Herbidospora galbida]|uniref:Uncharacterized protein n=1 Tax=Herbidospora galbida TaxID=2575442 RepID=A0A4U3M8E9_9ACTN|nr:hypothetical protein [Herbidospora galbida]TKK84582.1 hypothetical protein FDA94_28550 [Herbidospora galbida]